MGQAIQRAAAACERTIGLKPHDVQILGATILAQGKIAEMQTGEGKTLTAVMAVSAYASEGARVHVLTANDYLAERDARWMGPAYQELGLSVGWLTQKLSAEERRRAYACDVLYATPNEIGFDYLRDQLVLHAGDAVQRGFDVALIDEADSILIDEARIPLVIAGGEAPPDALVRRVTRLVEALTPDCDYTLDEFRRNVQLTDQGMVRVEGETGCANLYDPENEALLAAVQDALEAHALLRRDTDYIVRDGLIELVDELKGRVAQNRRWPAGLQTALEAKEGLALRAQGRILGSITMQHLVRLYRRFCGMTGTAITQAEEFRRIYGLEVVEVPTHRPVIRIDHPGVLFSTRAEKERAIVEEIARVHAGGRPILVGTASVAESERLSELVTAQGIPHQVLNARNDAAEAGIIAMAGERGAVTISTNMAGRGTDIPLGAGVAALGGLYVIGANRHESRRIDRQLRGRAGRQGDAGESRFLISLEDDLMVRYGVAGFTPDSQGIDAVQRVIEGQHLEARETLYKYETIIDNQRRIFCARRRELLEGKASPEVLAASDELWADHLAAAVELRDGIHWRSWGAQEPFRAFLHDAAAMFDETLDQLEGLSSGTTAAPPVRRGATWTYLVTDQPLGTMNERMAAGIWRRLEEIGVLTKTKD
jgi:preprotein translocase subunit SecA